MLIHAIQFNHVKIVEEGTKAYTWTAKMVACLIVVKKTF